ncbi:nuclear receptor-binding factor 2-like [Asterias amurensis]|uniref:nuclear receptor-binding factor 2-like n=1 Tax=Asterias amurensis TaxID=7602 RepID=UPI003AB250B0
MINKDETNIRMDPDSPLNRAHQMERQAERMLLSGRYDQAVICYNQAAENLSEAMNHTQDPSAILSLQLQLANLLKQPQIVRKRQQWGNRKQDMITTVWNGQFLTDTEETHSLEPDLACEASQVHVEEEDTRLRMDSLESRFSSDETDSLLTLVRQHFIVKDEQPGYRVSQLLTAMKTLSLGQRHPDNNEPSDNGPSALSANPVGRKVPKPERTVFEELLTQNEELRNHLVKLFQVLDSCENENQKLKATVTDLTRELEECRAQRVVRDGEHYRATLDTPFSLMEGFIGTPPSESLPPLSPLLIPDFEDMN